MRLIFAWGIIATGLALVVGGCGMGYLTWMFDKMAAEQTRAPHRGAAYPHPQRPAEWSLRVGYGPAVASVAVGGFAFLAGLSLRPLPGARRRRSNKEPRPAGRPCAECGAVIPGGVARCYHCSRVFRPEPTSPRPGPAPRPVADGPGAAPDTSGGAGASIPAAAGVGESLLVEQARRWAAGDRVPVEQLLAQSPPTDRSVVLDLIYQEVLLRERAGERPAKAEYTARFPALAGALSLQFGIDGLLAAPGAAAASTAGGESSPDCTGPFVPAGEPDGQLPELVAGRYEIGPELARGGMGIVFRAEDTVLGREVALKVLAPRLAGTAAARRFVEESRITARLEHPSVPPIQDLGTLPDGRSYLAMKLIRGRTLAEELRSRGSIGDDLDRFIGIFEQICLAVGFAHSKGIIHRDLKPANVMVGQFGEVQVMDWGLAKDLRAGRAEAPVADAQPDGPEDRTCAGQVMGTPAYMPPEQARGQIERVDERADVFSLGGILCTILTGQPPYTGANGREVLGRAAEANLAAAFDRLSGAIAELAGVEQAVESGPLIELAQRCLQASPDRRPAHAGEVAALVRAARAKAQKYQRSSEIEQALNQVNREYSAVRYGVLSLAGCGIRMLFVLAVVVLVFALFVRPFMH